MERYLRAEDNIIWLKKLLWILGIVLVLIGFGLNDAMADDAYCTSRRIGSTTFTDCYNYTDHSTTTITERCYGNTCYNSISTFGGNDTFSTPDYYKKEKGDKLW